MARVIFAGYGINQGGAYAGHELGGCLLDIWHVDQRIQELHPDDVLGYDILLDGADATRQAWSDALDWAIEEAQPGDILVIYGSGHGATGRLDDGSLVHMIILGDFDWNDRSTWFTADDFKAKLVKVRRGTHCFFGSDACYSGGLLARGLRDMGFARDITAKFLPNPDGEPEGRSRTFRQAISELDLDVALLSACGPNEMAGDSPDGGIFTCGWLALPQGKTAREIAIALDAENLGQSPEAHGRGIDEVWLK